MHVLASDSRWSINASTFREEPPRILSALVATEAVARQLLGERRSHD